MGSGLGPVGGNGPTDVVVNARFTAVRTASKFSLIASARDPLLELFCSETA